MKPSLTVMTNVYVEAAKTKHPRFALCIWIAPNCARCAFAYPARVVIVVCFLFAASLQTSSQTSIVIIRKPNELVAAADSKGTPSEGNTTVLGDRPLCKIKQTGDTFFAAAGLYLDTGTNFNLVEIVVEVSRRGGTSLEKATRFEEMIREPIIRAMRSIKSNKRDYYQRRFAGKESVQVAFFAWESGAPELHIRSVTVTGKFGRETANIDRKDCPGSDCVNNTMASFLGNNDAILRYVREHPEIRNTDLVAASQKLVEIEIADIPREVGPPIDILRITKDHTEWIKKKPECRDIQPEPTPTPQREGFPLPPDYSQRIEILIVLAASAILLCLLVFLKRR